MGHWFLWHNISQGHDRIVSRIDHSFVNELWMERDFSSQIQYLNQSLFDHSPLLCTCAKRDRGRGRPFWFLNYLAEHKKFESFVEAAWSSECIGNPMARVWHKLKCVKQAPKNFHVHHFRSIHDNMIKWQQALDEVQACLLGNSFDGGLHVKERVACEQFRKWQRMENYALRQKAKYTLVEGG